MSISIINRNPALMMSGYLRNHSALVSQSLNRLGSGLRVQDPSQGAAAYFMANQLSSRSSSTDYVAKELEDNIQGLKTGIDSLNEVKSLLEQQADLAKRASNSDDDNLRATLATEFDDIADRIDDIVGKATFNGSNLLNSQQTISVQIDEETSNTMSYTLFDTRYTQANGLNLGSGSGAGDDYSAASTVAAGFGGTGQADAVEKANAAKFYAAVSGTRADDSDASGLIKIERNINRMSTSLLILEGRQNTLENKVVNYEAAKSALVGVDDAEETTKLASAQMRQQAGAYYLAQTNSHFSQVQQLLFGMG